MSDDKPASLAHRFFRTSLLILGGILALWLALELVAKFWGWLLLIASIALMLWFAIAVYRYWWGRR